MKQLEIDWDNVIQHNENNAHSESVLIEQYARLNKNCRRLYEALLSGGKWSGRRIIKELDMMEYRRRIADLREAGIEIQEHTLKNGAKEWWIGN